MPQLLQEAVDAHLDVVVLLDLEVERRLEGDVGYGARLQVDLAKEARVRHDLRRAKLF
jgi:hypothetical protein